MDIKTKFNIGDTVADIDDRSLTGKVEEINITEFSSGERSIRYTFGIRGQYAVSREEEDLVLVPDRYIIDLDEYEYDQAINELEPLADDIPKIKELLYRAKKKEPLDD
jgi:hypothetical protein